MEIKLSIYETICYLSQNYTKLESSNPIILRCHLEIYQEISDILVVFFVLCFFIHV